MAGKSSPKGRKQTCSRSRFPPVLITPTTPANRTQRKPYAAKNIPGKGKGIVAKRKIRSGTELMVERAIFVARDFDSTNLIHTKLRALSVNVNGLSNAARRGILSLSHAPYQLTEWKKVVPPTHPLYDPAFIDMMVKIESNCFIIPVPGGRGLRSAAQDVGIFEETSRFNHSCDPNAAWETSHENSTIKVWAEKDIEIGEEIEISYIAVLEDTTVEQRASQLRGWMDKCLCNKCKGERKRSECGK
ncbi:SET domain-containing protein [Aulographum hederae CBS 113979]|uniref:SET domain-containing protein n=1 Tax=Aulographum hederae CBS 113979 TaxID=1176131 RepID=A0A6G1GIV1_9PEZI|nr:SET domain-containing protein [Aulographum hederae CBS 113979]